MGGFRRRLMGDVSAGRPNLPAGYTAYDWVKTDGNMYLNTGVQLEPSGYTLKVDFALESTQSSSAYLLGSGTVGTYAYDVISVSASGGTFSLSYINTSGTINSGSAVPTSTKCRLEINFNNSNEQLAKIVNLSTNSQLGSGYSGSSTYTWSTHGSLLLFKRMTSVSDSILTNCKIYKVHISSGVTGEHTFYPCTNENNVKGMYDVVNDVFISGTGSSVGSLILGNDS